MCDVWIWLGVAGESHFRVKVEMSGAGGVAQMNIQCRMWWLRVARETEDCEFSVGTRLITRQMDRLVFAHILHVIPDIIGTL